MFEVLPASGACLDRRLKWVTTSVLAHALVVALAVVATGGALEATRVADPEEAVLLFFSRPSEPPVEHRPAPAPGVIASR